MHSIIRYTADVQQLLGAKTKAEPWLHCIVNITYRNNPHQQIATYNYAIYVWDTRKVLETRSFSKVYHDTPDNLALRLMHKKKAFDNHNALQGNVSNDLKTIMMKLKRHAI